MVRLDALCVECRSAARKYKAISVKEGSTTKGSVVTARGRLKEPEQTADLLASGYSSHMLPGNITVYIIYSSGATYNLK